MAPLGKVIITRKRVIELDMEAIEKIVKDYFVSMYPLEKNFLVQWTGDVYNVGIRLEGQTEVTEE